MRQYTTANVEAICNVSIHAPGRGATLCHLCSHCMGLVSIHAPGRGATGSSPSPIISVQGFNSRTREGCDLFPIKETGRLDWFQFTHPGGVRLISAICSRPLLVSIHAPGRGATLDEVYLRLIFIRFNSRTREGCDHPKNEYQSQISCFNSRTREGCDIDGVVVLARYGVVSIHAPGRGAT